MMEMDVKTIKSIVESPSFEVKEATLVQQEDGKGFQAGTGVPNAAAKAKGPILQSRSDIED